LSHIADIKHQNAVQKLIDDYNLPKTRETNVKTILYNIK